MVRGKRKVRMYLFADLFQQFFLLLSLCSGSTNDVFIPMGVFNSH